MFQRKISRPAERAGKMRNRRVRSDDEIEAHHHGGRIEKGVGARIESLKPLDRQLRGADVLIRVLHQADKPDARDRRELSEFRKRHASFEIDLGVATPADADPICLDRR